MNIPASSNSYQNLCTEYYELDKPSAPQDALAYYLEQAREANGPILEPMCGTGRFLTPLVETGFDVTGFDNSSQMLKVCRDKNIHYQLFEASFESFKPQKQYSLVFIPSGSFCLLTHQEAASKALNRMHDWLEIGGKLILEVETLNAADTSLESMGIWKANWVKKTDGSLIVLNHASQFDHDTSIATTLCRYEHWKNNQINQTEVEEFCVKRYATSEIEEQLSGHGFEVLKRLHPYTGSETKDGDDVVLYECVKIDKHTTVKT